MLIRDDTLIWWLSQIYRVNIEREENEYEISTTTARQAHNKEHKRLNKKKMSLFKGENDTTKNSDNMLTMNQKNIPAVIFSSPCGCSLFFFRCCTFLLYFNFYLARKFFYINFLWMEMCPSHFLAVRRRWYHVLFVNQFSQLQRHRSVVCTCVDHNVCLIIALEVKCKGNRRVSSVYGGQSMKVDNLQMHTMAFFCWLF